MELVHLASLYHDDVMDEATVRRNVESVNARFGNLVAIVAGDFLLARSAEIAAGLGTEIAGLLAATLGELCQGQVAEVHAAFQVGSERGRATTRRHRRQDGGAHGHLVPDRRAHRWAAPRPRSTPSPQFGRYFGMVFQVRDDILDVVGTEAELGKPAGQDLAEGIYTLPVLLALADPEAGPELRPLLGQPLGQPERDKARSIVAALGGHRRTRWSWPGGMPTWPRRRPGSGPSAGAGRGLRQPGPLPGRRPARRLTPALTQRLTRRGGRPTTASTDRPFTLVLTSRSARPPAQLVARAPTRGTWPRWPPAALVQTGLERGALEPGDPLLQTGGPCGLAGRVALASAAVELRETGWRCRPSTFSMRASTLVALAQLKCVDPGRCGGRTTGGGRSGDAGGADGQGSDGHHTDDSFLAVGMM